MISTDSKETLGQTQHAAGTVYLLGASQQEVLEEVASEKQAKQSSLVAASQSVNCRETVVTDPVQSRSIRVMMKRFIPG